MSYDELTARLLRKTEQQAARIEQLEAEAKTRTLDYLGQVGQLSEELERLRAALDVQSNGHKGSL